MELQEISKELKSKAICVRKMNLHDEASAMFQVRSNFKGFRSLKNKEVLVYGIKRKILKTKTIKNKKYIVCTKAL